MGLSFPPKIPVQMIFYYIKTGNGWLYLTVILNLADRKVVSWTLSNTMEAKRTNVAAWRMAIRNRLVNVSRLFHSD